MKNSFVADTMALVLRLESRKLPSKIKSLFEDIENEKVVLIIPAMVLVEIGYLAEKRRIETNLKEELITNDPVIAKSRHLKVKW